MEFIFKHNAEQVQAEMERLARDKLPDAIALAVNRTALAAKAEIRTQMEGAFDRPTPYTMDALVVLYGRKADPVAKLMVKDRATKAPRSAKYWLSPQVFGGPRGLKGFEIKLQNAGILGPNQYAMPGKFAQMDQYGNMSRGRLVAILSDVQAWTSESTVRNSTLKTRNARVKRNARKEKRGGVYFAVTTRRGALRPGIYERLSFAFGAAARPVLIFVNKAPAYSKRLPYEETAQRVMETRYQEELRDSISYVVGKAIDMRAAA